MNPVDLAKAVQQAISDSVRVRALIKAALSAHDRRPGEVAELMLPVYEVLVQATRQIVVAEGLHLSQWSGTTDEEVPAHWEVSFRAPKHDLEDLEPEAKLMVLANMTALSIERATGLEVAPIAIFQDFLLWRRGELPTDDLVSRIGIDAVAALRELLN